MASKYQYKGIAANSITCDKKDFALVHNGIIDIEEADATDNKAIARLIKNKLLVPYTEPVESGEATPPGGATKPVTPGGESKPATPGADAKSATATTDNALPGADTTKKTV